MEKQTLVKEVCPANPVVTKNKRCSIGYNIL